MTKITKIAIVLVGIALSPGCAFERHVLAEPGKSQFIKVESGDDWHFTLLEPVDQQWDWRCDDGDVEVKISHDPNAKAAAVHIHIHRGYDGPSTVRFALRADGGRTIVKAFNLGLFKRTGDEAFWK